MKGCLPFKPIFLTGKLVFDVEDPNIGVVICSVIKKE